MFIKEVHIKNFGGISNRHIDFEDGINVIYGENESGKSTIFDFIHAMFYGLEIQRGKASKNDLYRKYEPWENPTFFAGTIRFETGGKTFRLERNFYKKDKRESLICEDDGEELSVADGDLDVLLGGIDGETYRNTYMILQENKPVDYSTFFSNDEENADITAQVTGALAYLKDEKKKNENSIKEINEKREKEIIEYELECKYLEQDIIKQQEILDNMEKLEKTEDLSPVNEGFSHKKVYLILGAIIIGIAMGLWLKAMAIIPDIILLIVTVLIIMKDNRKPVNNNYLIELERLNIQKENALDIIRERKVLLHNLKQSIKDEREYLENIKELKENIQAIVKAHNDIVSTYNFCVSGRKIKVEDEASDIFSDITNKRYSKMSVDKNKDLKILGDNIFRDIDSFSSGTKSQANLSIRLSAILNSGNEEMLPILFDDAFVTFDDDRLKKSMERLVNIKRQMIIFTCQNREMQYMYMHNIEFNMVII